MRILALDLGKRMGVADGSSLLMGQVAPALEAVVLRGTSAEKRAGFLGSWLNTRLLTTLYDLIITEAPLSPAASKSADATIGQLYLHGALQGVAGAHGVNVTCAPVMGVRRHFCGQATASPRRRGERTMAQARVDRNAINTLVLRRAILLGYLPEESTDWDQANAAALWDYACAKFGRATPETLLMFGAQR
jgi:hypothetical protein